MAGGAAEKKNCHKCTTLWGGFVNFLWAKHFLKIFIKIFLRLWVIIIKVARLHMDKKYENVSLCTAVGINNLPERPEKIRSQSTNAQNQPSIAKALHTVTAIFDSNKRGVRLSTLSSSRISVLHA